MLQLAYEDGYNIFDYFMWLFKNYREDYNLFSKTLQIITYYQSRADYPDCFVEMKEVVSLYVGSIDFLKYAIDDRMCWNINNAETAEVKNYIASNNSDETVRLTILFKRDFYSFCMSIKPVIHKSILMDYKDSTGDINGKFV